MQSLSLLALGTGPWVGLLLLALVAGAAAVWAYYRWQTAQQQSAAQRETQRILAEAQDGAKELLRQAEIDSKAEHIKRLEVFEKETAEARRELRDEERRLTKRQDLLDEKLESLTAKERQVELAVRSVAEKERALAAKDREMGEILEQQRAEVLRISRLTEEEARAQVLRRVEQEVEHEASQLIERTLQRAKENADEQAREIIIQSIQRYAATHTCDATVSTVDIPTDDMKGRVIGREGRNIRAFEKATGVDVIVDDTPGVVVVSAFDPVRREVARLALEKLIQDGRIHPTRIEEIVAETQEEVNKQILEAGKRACLEANVRGLHGKLSQLLGRLSLRTSYGQNVLRHSMEVAFLAQTMAEELGLDGELARRAGLLHDIGKAVDHEVEGGHPEIGADLLRRYGENETVIAAAAGHHDGGTGLYTAIVAAADAISASRPGARRETLDRYLKRLEKLEEIAVGFEGVKQAYAIQAGREIRVIVDAESVDDRLAGKIARDIAKKIEEELTYPGEVRVTLIRETRCVEYAR